MTVIWRDKVAPFNWCEQLFCCLRSLTFAESQAFLQVILPHVKPSERIANSLTRKAALQASENVTIPKMFVAHFRADDKFSCLHPDNLKILFYGSEAASKIKGSNIVAPMCAKHISHYSAEVCYQYPCQAQNGPFPGR